MHDLTESQQVTFPSVCEFHNLAENMAASCTNSLQMRMEMDLGQGDDFLSDGTLYEKFPLPYTWAVSGKVTK